MGAGASTVTREDATMILAELASQKLKPADGRELQDLEQAREEVKKLRSLMQNMDIGLLQEKAGTLKGASETSEKILTMKEETKEDDENNHFAGTPFSEDVKQRAKSYKSIKLDMTQYENKKAQSLLHLITDKMEARFLSLRETFLEMDTDRSGFLSSIEFRKACSNWGINIDDEDFILINSTYAHQERVDQEDRGINYLEFIALMTRQCRYTPGEGEGNVGLDAVLAKLVSDSSASMRASFKKFDLDGSGSVDRHELRIVFSKNHIEFTDEEFEELFEAHDKNQDGKFSYGEFVRMIQHNVTSTVPQTTMQADYGTTFMQ